MKTKTAIIALLAISFFAMYSCKKDKTNNDEETELLIEVQKNDAEATKVYNLINDEVNDLSSFIDSSNYSVPSKTLDSCINVTINHPDTMTWPKTIVLDFAGNCTTANGNVLSGQIVIVQTDRYRADGMVRTITLNGFRINGNLVSGTKTITNIGLVNGFKTFPITIANGSITTPDGEVIVTRSAQRTRTWIQGESTLTKWDDVYSITGITSGTTRSDKSYTATIIEPLIVARNCRWIKQGKISLVIEDLPVIVIDFGTGSCDQTATVTVNENTRTITLRN